MAAKYAFVLALAVLPLASGAVFARGQAFLGNGMQPEVVARTLSSVEDEWKAQAAVFAECDSTSGLPGATIVNCADAPTSFGKSCNTVVKAIVDGSGGDKDVVKEYMGDVCTQKAVSGWHQLQCNNLALAVRTSMSADKYANRMGFDSGKLCVGFWSSFLGEEKVRIAKEKTERQAAETKAAEEAAEAEKKSEEERKKEAARKMEEDAERAKEEAKVNAAKAEEEAKAKVAEKKAEAEAVQEAAKKKMEEAAAAESEHKKAQADLAKQETATKATKVAATKPTEVAVTVASPTVPKPVVAVAVKEVQAAAQKIPEPVAVKPAAVEPAAAKASVAKTSAATPAVKATK